MLTSVPLAIRRSMRQVTLNHANAIGIEVLRKVVTRVELTADGEEDELGGAATLGGAGVLRAEDEADYEYQSLGSGKMMRAGQYAPMDMNDRGNGTVAEEQSEWLIECLLPDTDQAHFEAEKDDIVVADLGEGMLLVYEVVNAVGTVSIPPYTRRYMLNPRDDLNYLDPPFGD